jgi:hypothetical protein
MVSWRRKEKRGEERGGCGQTMIMTRGMVGREASGTGPVNRHFNEHLNSSLNI